MAMGGGGSSTEATPYINMTPLIDVLLVLLIIFMVISPQKPHRFEAKIPEKPPEDQKNVEPDVLALVVTVPREGNEYKLNTETYTGLQALYQRLFDNIDKRPPDRRSVFIKAPRGIPFGEVVKVIDIVKKSGAQPIGLQIEGLDQ
ncbi:MAG: biopolymer transporter ExbD [Blastocatellia bacterium]|nr:biopolymer transporter ExbD [Blastocatellia bacterium]